MSIIQLDPPQSQSQSSLGFATNSQSSEEDQTQQPHPPQSLPDQLLDPTPNRTDETSIQSDDKTETSSAVLFKQPNNTQDSPHHDLQIGFHSVTKNGHLAVAAVNSLDSGISANGGYGTEEPS